MQYATAKLTATYVLPLVVAFCILLFWHSSGDYYASVSGIHWRLGLLETTGWVHYHSAIGITSFRAHLYPECFLSVTGASLLAVIVADFGIFYLIHLRKRFNQK